MTLLPSLDDQKLGRHQPSCYRGAMLVFISGSVNAGKSSTAHALASKLGAEFLDLDDLAAAIEDFSLESDIPKVIQQAADLINGFERQGISVVANYVLREEDYQRLRAALQVDEQHFVTLAPPLSEVQRDRGRGLSTWEKERIALHYQTGIASPSFGITLDNSGLSIEETTEQIIELIIWAA